MEISVRKSFVYRRISWKLSIFILYSWEKFFCPFPVLVKLLPPGSKSINSHYRYRNFLDRRLSWGRDRLVYSANFHAKSSNKRFYNPEHIRKERSKYVGMWSVSDLLDKWRLFETKYLIIDHLYYEKGKESLLMMSTMQQWILSLDMHWFF